MVKELGNLGNIVVSKRLMPGDQQRVTQGPGEAAFNFAEVLSDGVHAPVSKNIVSILFCYFLPRPFPESDLVFLRPLRQRSITLLAKPGKR